ncbi:MAG TPA: type II toxin-antitoxin system prevent-host-death family antitoxin [Caulobacteraceae bacterium]|jgi:prevent-host-death family protein
MRIVTAREANQNFSRLLTEVEAGETVVVTKHGRAVAELRPRSDDRTKDPVWRAAYEKMIQHMRETPETGYRVGEITEEDKYGDAPL